jgi:murein DD-endopeptidase MepM/ murein hydrolase activator NlpD
MTKTSTLLLASLTALTGCLSADAPGDDTEKVGTIDQQLSAPPGMGRYCSMSWPGGGWGFASYTNLVSDPCAFLRGNSTTGTVERAGLYATNAINNVVLRCENSSYIILQVGNGNAPLTSAYNLASGHTGCIFTVSPREMPIFGRPYDPAGYQFTNTGFDFARGYTVNAKAELGDSDGGTAATIVDWRGQDMSPPKWTYDNHDAWDINMAQGTKIYAAADGYVQMARFRDITNACPGGYTVPNQGEVFIKHTVSGGTNTGLYDEYFVTYYAHFSQIVATTGQFVHKGDLIGYSGTTGCSSGPHLHFGTFRLTNTASKFVYPFVINTNFAAGQDQNSANGYQIAIEPHGFYPTAGFDPWAWRGYPWGALSLYLWDANAAPPNGSW